MIFKCFYLTHFSTFTFSELSDFSKALLNQVLTLESPWKNIVNRYFLVKSSTSVNSLLQRREYDDLETGIWNLETHLLKLNGTCNTIFFEIQSSNITETAFLSYSLVSSCSQTNDSSLALRRHGKCGIFCCVTC